MAEKKIVDVEATGNTKNPAINEGEIATHAPHNSSIGKINNKSNVTPTPTPKRIKSIG